MNSAVISKNFEFLLHLLSILYNVGGNNWQAHFGVEGVMILLLNKKEKLTPKSEKSLKSELVKMLLPKWNSRTRSWDHFNSQYLSKGHWVLYINTALKVLVCIFCYFKHLHFGVHYCTEAVCGPNVEKILQFWLFLNIEEENLKYNFNLRCRKLCQNFDSSGLLL